MAEVYTKSRGVVLRFNSQKGYGFIKPDDGGDDLFVHHSDINSDGFRKLRKNQTVEFYILLDEQEKTKAGEVSIISDPPIQNSATTPNDGGVKKVIKCYNCGKFGHIAKDCHNSNDCYNCCLVGHFARDCTNASYCLNCNGEVGHTTRDCTKTRSRGDGGSYNCYNCGGAGHFARDCTSTRDKGSSNGGRDGGSCFNCNKEGTMLGIVRS